MRLSRGLYFVLFATVSSAFFASLEHYMRTRQFVALATICGPVLAVLFGFSALLYNRARAFPSGKEQRRSLYAAERAMQSTLLFLVGTAVGGIGAVVIWALPSIGNTAVHPYWSTFGGLLLFLSIILVLYSFASFFIALQTVSRRLLKWLPIRKLARSLKSQER
ncbi:hypothetical protein NC77_02355 [Janthinobacterium lividum]|jgi:hypothetical protein|nr:hypothetical protein NC77_02355 [Janthinobacterium lividum]